MRSQMIIFCLACIEVQFLVFSIATCPNINDLIVTHHTVWRHTLHYLPTEKAEYTVSWKGRVSNILQTKTILSSGLYIAGVLYSCSCIELFYLINPLIWINQDNASGQGRGRQVPIWSSIGVSNIIKIDF